MLTIRPSARVLLLLPALALACRATPLPHPELTGCHPACAGARATAIGDAGAQLRGADAAPAPALETRAEPAPSSAAWLCPMHLHLGAPEPGRCPECNMKLVPRAHALEHDHGQ
jgi:hypothetical protein